MKSNIATAASAAGFGPISRAAAAVTLIENYSDDAFPLLKAVILNVNFNHFERGRTLCFGWCCHIVFCFTLLFYDPFVETGGV